jgi:DNA-binding beta-propeller fold protein YncE
MNSRDIFSVRGPKPQALAQIHSTMDLLPQQQFFTFALDPRKNQTMKSSITSNLRPLLRAVYAFIFAIAALWVVPRNAQAQLLVTQMPLYPDSTAGIVNIFSPDTGVESFDFISGLSQPVALALSGDGHTLFVSNADGGFVGKYDLTTGQAINRTLITGVDGLWGLAVDRDILVLVSHAGVPGKGVINVYTVSGGKAGDLITGLDGALDLASNSEHELFVSLAFSGSVDCLQPLRAPPLIKYAISGLLFPQGVAADTRALYVANGDGVSEFDARTGKVIKGDFITELHLPGALALWQGHGILFVLYSDPASNDYRVGKYDARTGNVIKKDFITGLHYAQAIAVH